MKDLENRSDVIILVDAFYAKVKDSEILGPIFLNQLGADWDHHLEVIYNFWSAILFGEKGYEGNPMQKHINLNRSTPLTDEAFEEWLGLFNSTLDEHFAGLKTEEAKSRARSISELMKFKIKQG